MYNSLCGLANHQMNTGIFRYVNKTYPNRSFLQVPAFQTLLEINLQLGVALFPVPMVSGPFFCDITFAIYNILKDGHLTERPFYFYSYLLLRLFKWPTGRESFLIVIGFIPFVIGIAYAIKIEQQAGYYECAKCRYRYVPAYKVYLWQLTSTEQDICVVRSAMKSHGRKRY